MLLEERNHQSFYKRDYSIFRRETISRDLVKRNAKRKN